MEDMLMKKVFFAVLIVLLVCAIGCAKQHAPAAKTSSPTQSSMSSCKVDSDCVCGGVDKASGMCFMGNKDYYDKNVDKSKQCPDFCTGIAGNLVMRCIDNRCIQMFECISDMDCQSGSCINNRCAGR
jgi:hypothetical protein